MITAQLGTHAVEIIDVQPDGSCMVHSILSEPIAQTYKGGAGFISSEWDIVQRDTLTDIRHWDAEQTAELWAWVESMTTHEPVIEDPESILDFYRDVLDLIRG